MNWPDHYRFYPDLCTGSSAGNYSLRPIDWSDRESIRQWRNAQIEVLRQIDPLTVEDQDGYFSDVVLPQFEQQFPPQFMFAFLKNSELIGYGALVHIHWGDLRAEVSFLTATDRLDEETFAQDWKHYLDLLKPMAQRLGLHKLTTETYDLRKNLIPILEANGFIQEGVLRNHHFLGDEFHDSLVHGIIIK